MKTMRELAWGLWIASALLAAGCGRDQPAAPGTHALTGHVRLVGHLTASDGHSLGTRYEDTADGVPVDLVRGTSLVASTRTSQGAFRFAGLEDGSYFVRAHVFGALAAQSAVVTLPGRDVALANPVVLESVGDLYPAPNPSDSVTTITFGIASLAGLSLRVLALDGTLVRELHPEEVLDVGVYLTRWSGIDTTGHPVPAGLYWMTLESGTDQRAQLLFR